MMAVRWGPLKAVEKVGQMEKWKAETWDGFEAAKSVDSMDVFVVALTADLLVYYMAVGLVEG